MVKIKKYVEYGIGASILGGVLSDQNVPSTIRTVAVGGYAASAANDLLPKQRRKHHGR